jgi:type IV secretory pathway VirB10-like protein
MTGSQGELDFNAECDVGARNKELVAEDPISGRSQGGNRRLAIVALGSIVLAALTTLMLARLHASPAPLEASADTSQRPTFPDDKAANAQLFVAPTLSSVHPSDNPANSGTAPTVDFPAQLAMPLTSPNARWQLPNGTTDTATAAPPPGPAKPDALMVDLPWASAQASQQDGVIHARRHDPHGLTLAAGSIIGCALETAIDSSRGGYVTCVVTDDVVSDDARTVLIERGTHVLGEYRSDARQGDARIGIIWNRLRKSDGTTVDLASPATDQQGRSGISGAIDNHWFTRIGAAALLSMIEDGMAALSAPKADGTTMVFGNTTATGSTLSQKVLDASINLPPTISVNPGARISILVAKDIDFQSAYVNR